MKYIKKFESNEDPDLRHLKKQVLIYDMIDKIQEFNKKYYKGNTMYSGNITIGTDSETIDAFINDVNFIN